MKPTTLSVVALLLTAANTNALVYFGQQGQIDLNVMASGFHDSAIRARETSDGDYVFTLAPSLVYLRPSRNLDLSLTAGVRIIRYVDFTQYDNENYFFDADLSPNAEYQTSRFRFSGDLTLNSETRSDEEVGDIVTIRNYGASGSLEYDPNRRFTLITNLSFQRRDPDASRYSQLDRVSADIRGQVPLNSSLSTHAGAGYTNSNSELAQGDSETYTYFGGFSGTLFTKLDGSLSAGIQERKSETRGDISSPYVSADLTWSIDDRTSATISANQNFGTTIDDRTTESFTSSLAVRRSLSRDLSANARVSYVNSDFYGGMDTAVDRNDESVSFGGGITYQIVQWGSISLDASYSDRTSTDDTFEYDRTRVGVIFQGNW